MIVVKKVLSIEVFTHLIGMITIVVDQGGPDEQSMTIEPEHADALAQSLIARAEEIRAKSKPKG